jgi:hypothetical protein
MDETLTLEGMTIYILGKGNNITRVPFYFMNCYGRAM